MDLRTVFTFSVCYVANACLCFHSNMTSVRNLMIKIVLVINH